MKSKSRIIRQTYDKNGRIRSTFYEDGWSLIDFTDPAVYEMEDDKEWQKWADKPDTSVPSRNRDGS